MGGRTKRRPRTAASDTLALPGISGIDLLECMSINPGHAIRRLVGEWMSRADCINPKGTLIIHVYMGVPHLSNHPSLEPIIAGWCPIGNRY